MKQKHDTSFLIEIDGNDEIAELLNGLKADSTDADKWCDLAFEYDEEGEVELALKCYANAQVLDPDDFTAPFNAGMIYKQNGNIDKALELFIYCTELKPNNFNGWNELGSVYFTLKENEKAFACFDKAIELSPENELSYTNMGYNLINLGQPERAVSYIEKAIALGDMKMSYFNRAHAYLINGEAVKAVEYYTKSAQQYDSKKDFWSDYKADFSLMPQNGVSKEAYNALIPAIKQNLSDSGKDKTKSLPQNAMTKTWSELKDALKKHAPQILPSINTGATDEQIAKLETLIGAKMPAQFIDFYKIHNGQTLTGKVFNENLVMGTDELLSIERIIEEWNIWNGISELREMKSEPEEGVKDDWWNPLWIPISADGGGDSYCIDLDPATGGKKGQIIKLLHDDASRELVAGSLKDFVSMFTDFD